VAKFRRTLYHVTESRFATANPRFQDGFLFILADSSHCLLKRKSHYVAAFTFPIAWRSKCSVEVRRFLHSFSTCPNKLLISNHSKRAKACLVGRSTTTILTGAADVIGR
jgi:hypothetical protein